MQKRLAVGGSWYITPLLLLLLLAALMRTADGFTTISFPRVIPKPLVATKQQQPIHRFLSVDRSIISLKESNAATFPEEDISFVLTTLLLVSVTGIAMEQKVSIQYSILFSFRRSATHIKSEHIDYFW